MALYKDGKVYRTLEQQVGHLTEAHEEQLETNEQLENHMQDIDATIDLLPTKEYVDNADALKADKTYVDTELNKKVSKITDSSGYEKAYVQLSNTISLKKVSPDGQQNNVILATDNNGFIIIKDPVNSSNPVNKGTMDTALAGKQSTLTLSSINDGTLDKAIGFDSQGNLVKGIIQGGGGDAFYSLGTFDFITSGGSDIPVILTQEEFEELRDTDLPLIALFKFSMMGQYDAEAYIYGIKENIKQNGSVFAISLFFENKFVQGNNPGENINDVFAGIAMEESGQYYINMSHKSQQYQRFLESGVVSSGTLNTVLGFDSSGNLKQGSPSVSFPAVSGQYDNALKIPIKNVNGDWKEADPTQIMDFDYSQHSGDTNAPQPIMAYYNEDYSRWEFTRAYNGSLISKKYIHFIRFSHTANSMKNVVINIFSDNPTACTTHNEVASLLYNSYGNVNVICNGVVDNIYALYCHATNATTIYYMKNDNTEKALSGYIFSVTDTVVSL